VSDLRMTTLLFTTSLLSAPVVPSLLTPVLHNALEDDERELGDVAAICAMATDPGSCFRSLNLLASSKPVDGLVIFGSTAAHFDLGTLMDFAPVTLRIRRQAAPIPCVKLPGGASRQWMSYETHEQATIALREVLRPRSMGNILRPPGHPIAIGEEEMN
jgi:hypothetical protein